MFQTYRNLYDMMYGFSNIGPIKCTTDTNDSGNSDSIEYIRQLVGINGIAMIIIPTIVMLNNIYVSANTLNVSFTAVFLLIFSYLFFHLIYLYYMLSLDLLINLLKKLFHMVDL